MATYDLTSSTPSSLRSGDIINCPYSGTYKSITLPKGTYKLECWGAQGIYSSASPTNSAPNSMGGYASGRLTLTSATTFYIYVGGRPYYSKANSTTYASGTSDAYTGGWNGGGGKVQASSYNDNGAGGGATDICLVSSDVTLNSTTKTYTRTSASYLSRIIVAGGGGGGRSSNANSNGGYGTTNTSASSSTSGGTQGSPGFGYGGYSAQAGDDYGCGGGGWYGGATNGDSYGYGGSSFVWSDAHASAVPSGYTPAASLKMTEVNCIAGNHTMPSVETVGSTTTGREGNGYCRITVIEIKSCPIRYKSSSNTIVEAQKAYVKTSSGWQEITDFSSYFSSSKKYVIRSGS